MSRKHYKVKSTVRHPRPKKGYKLIKLNKPFKEKNLDGYQNDSNNELKKAQ